MYHVFAHCKELGAIGMVHAENGDLIYAVSAVRYRHTIVLWTLC